MSARNIYPNDVVSVLQHDLSANGFGFIIGEFSGGDSGDDVAQYYGLGKCGGNIGSLKRLSMRLHQRATLKIY